MLTISIITTPREPQTLNVSVNSLKKAGYNGRIRIFAEPGQYLLNLGSVDFHINSELQGAFKNFDYALKTMHMTSLYDYVMIASDDIIYHPDFLTLVNSVAEKKEKNKVYSFLTVRNMPNVKEVCKNHGWNVCNNGFDTFWGGLFLFNKWQIEKITTHDFYGNHLKTHKQAIDACIAETCKQLGFTMYLHNPSPTYTIGKISTCNHLQINDGYGWKPEI